jgi:hypothetical protein
VDLHLADLLSNRSVERGTEGVQCRAAASGSNNIDENHFFPFPVIVIITSFRWYIAITEAKAYSFSCSYVIITV